MLGAEHAATVVSFLRAHRGPRAPPGSTVPACQTVRVFIVPLPHTKIPHLVATPVFWAKVSLRCQDSSIPSQTRGIVFAEHFRRRAAGEIYPQVLCASFRLSTTVPRLVRCEAGNAVHSSLGPHLVGIVATQKSVRVSRCSQYCTPTLQRLRPATTLPSRFVGSERHRYPADPEKK